jgi:hypothetical protein
MKFVRLKEFDKQKGRVCKTFVSASGRHYVAGVGGFPSPLVEVTDEAEIEYIRTRGIEQFEVIDVPNLAAAQALIQREMEDAARTGAAPVRALVQSEEKKAEKTGLKPSTSPRLPSAATADTGKVPETKADDKATDEPEGAPNSEPGDGEKTESDTDTDTDKPADDKKVRGAKGHGKGK